MDMDFCSMPFGQENEKSEEGFPDSRDVNPVDVNHVCAEHRDAYGICQVCGRVIPGTTAAFDLLGDTLIEEE